MTNYTTSAGVQQFTITVSTGNTTGTATINAVGSGAYITCGGSNTTVASDPAESQAYLTLTNSTTITATRTTSGSNSIIVSGSITDGDPTNLIKSVQYGTVSISSSTSGTASISAVTNANAATHYLGNLSTDTTIHLDTDITRLALSSTTVTATVPTSGTTTTGFVIVEFQGSALAQSVQNIAATSATSVTSFTATLSSLTMANSVSFYGGSTISTVTTNLAEGLQYGAITASTTFTVNVNTAFASTKTFNASVVSFISGLLNSSVQRGTTTLTAVTSNTSIPSTINVSYAGAMWLGNTTTVTATDNNEALGLVELQFVTPAEIRTEGNSATANSVTVTFTAPPSGSFMVVGVKGLSASETVTGVTDSASQTWSQVPGAYATDTSGGQFSDIWYFNNTAGSVTSVTVSLSASVFCGAQWWAFSGVQATSPVGNVTALNSQPTSSAPVSGALSTSAANSLIFVCIASGSIKCTVASPYTGEPNEGQTAYNITTSEVINQTAAFTRDAGSSTYCTSSAEFLSANTEQVTVTKSSATGNITASWEIFEFHAYSAGTSLTINAGCMFSFLAVQRFDATYLLDCIATQLTDRILPDEFLSTQKQDELLPGEFLATQRIDPSAPLESLGTQRLDFTEPFESLGGGTTQVSDSEFPLEVIAAQRIDAYPRLENLTIQQTDQIVRFESLSTQSSDALSRFDFRASQLNDGTFLSDFISNQLIDATQRLESTGALLTDQTLRDECISTQSTDRPLPDESLTSQRSDGLFPTESVATQRNDGESPFENTGATVVTFDGLLPLEWKASQAGNVTTELENIVNALCDTILRLETLTLAKTDPGLLHEFKASNLSDTSSRAESVATQATDHIYPTESVAKLNADRSVLSEILASAMTNAISPLECLFLSRIDRLTVGEFIGIIRGDATLPSETLLTMQAVTLDCMLPLEWTATLGADPKAGLESILTLRIDYLLPLEERSTFFPSQLLKVTREVRSFLTATDTLTEKATRESRNLQTATDTLSLKVTPDDRNI